MALLDDDRLFDAEPKARGIARALYAGIKDLPLVSPHGHTEPRWYAENEKFPDPAQLLIVPDHYVFRMLFSQGIRLEDGPLVVTIVSLIILIYLVSNLVVDVLYAVLDPRIRHE